MTAADHDEENGAAKAEGTPPPATGGAARATFYFTYVCLITTGTITLIEALRTKNAALRHVMNLETCVSVVAAYFYSVFTDIVKRTPVDRPLPWADINKLRYLDWFITTPLMLLALCTVLSIERGRGPPAASFVGPVLALDVAMLALGYLGETAVLDRRVAWAASSAAFVAMFALLWVRGRPASFAARLAFFTFLAVWSGYGAVYMSDEETKNTVFNVLDLLAKALVGILFWVYFARVVSF